VRLKERCVCPVCRAIHKIEVSVVNMGGAWFDHKHRVVLLCVGCIRSQRGTARQILERERARSINLN
jgi:hypothetical protein